MSVTPDNDLENGAVLTGPFERCQWQCDAGCGIYAARPSPCEAYHCMWRLGFGGDDARPDRLGVVLEGSPWRWLFAIETRPDAYQEPLVQEYMRAIRENAESPAKYIRVTPWGAQNPGDGGYWVDAAPTPEEMAAVLDAAARGDLNQ